MVEWRDRLLHVAGRQLCASSAAVQNSRRVHHVVASVCGHRRRNGKCVHLLRVVEEVRYRLSRHRCHHRCLYREERVEGLDLRLNCHPNRSRWYQMTAIVFEQVARRSSILASAAARRAKLIGKRKLSSLILKSLRRTCWRQLWRGSLMVDGRAKLVLDKERKKKSLTQPRMPPRPIPGSKIRKLLLFKSGRLKPRRSLTFGPPSRSP